MVQSIVHEGQAFTLLASAARTAGANGDTVFVGGRQRYAVLLSVADASLTGAADTLDVYVDLSPDSGTTWVNAIHFTQRAGDASGAVKEWAVLDSSAPAATVTDVTTDAASGVVNPYVFGDAMRARWAIVDSGDGNSSHTFGIKVFAT